ncbi:MAG: HigA family addiction module antitoxin [Chloroflexota bacterium]
MTSDLQSSWTPFWAVAPGEILVEALAERRMSQAELARRMARPLKTISEIANGKTAITPETALQLERTVGISASFWNGLESRYRESLARRRAAEELEQHVGWSLKFPLADMVKFGVIPPGANRTQTVSHLLSIFEVSNPAGWEQQWGRTTAALRRSTAHKWSAHALAAWLRWGEIRATQLDVAPYDEGKFTAALGTARGLSRLSAFELAIEQLQDLMKAAGVAVVVLPELTGTRVSGAARWLRSGFPLIQLSLRYLSDDQFWFSLFHEADHIRRGRKRIDYVDDLEAEPRAETDEEAAADAFARDHLIPPGRYDRFVVAGDLTAESVRSFASELGISPGIVVGRLQRDRAIPPSRMNYLKRRYQVALVSSSQDH